jgi:[ribosomal protein S5]-alanine N-acetyltransferase
MILATDRLLLREFLTQDWHAVLAYQADPRFLRSAPWAHHLQEGVERLVQDFIGWQHAQPRCKYQLAIVLLTTHLVIGTCGIRMATAHAQEAELAYEFHPDYWDRAMRPSQLEPYLPSLSRPFVFSACGHSVSPRTGRLYES